MNNKFSLKKRLFNIAFYSILIDLFLEICIFRYEIILGIVKALKYLELLKI